MGSLPPAALAGVVGVDGLLAQHSSQLLEGGRLLAAQEDGGIHVADDGIGVVPVSYTHLDVYKRQFSSCSTILLCKSPKFNQSAFTTFQLQSKLFLSLIHI